MGLTVACVLRSGGAYGPNDVARLRDGVARHLKTDYRFVCLSDVPVPCERRILQHNWPGWWSKIELFQMDGPLLYFDLDTVICGDLTDIAAQAEDWTFTALRDFYREKGLGSGVMAWNCNPVHLYKTFTLDPSGWIDRCSKRGDQYFIEQNISGAAFWQSVLPRQVVSYKVHVQKADLTDHTMGDGTVPADARVICFHGLPKLSDLSRDDAVLEHVI
jgi:hypothetical protein